MGHPTPTIQQACALLDLAGPGDAATLRQAFRRAVKDARPDLPGGDAERFRRIIEAYRLLQQVGGQTPALAAPVARPMARPVFALDIDIAIHGGPVTLPGPSGKRFRVAVPPGLRTGDHLRLRGADRDGQDLFTPVRIQNRDDLSARGDDLHMSWPIEPRLLADGGRVEIDTHAGPRNAWLAPGAPASPRLRLKGLGLPARGSRPQGHLFVTLTPREDVPSAAEHLLYRFTSVWTPQRMAA